MYLDQRFDEGNGNGRLCLDKDLTREMKMEKVGDPMVPNGWIV